MTVRLFVSISEKRAAALMTNGPRRDFREIAKATGGEVTYAPESRTRLRRLFGPHVRQAWWAAAKCRENDALFFDGEHIGLPALVFLRLRRRRPGRVVMLGHFVSRGWKRALFWLATRVGPGGLLVVHSERQRGIIQGALGRRWSVDFVPYQVDCQYWRPAGTPRETSLVVAAGSENRDYDCLVEAAHFLDAQVVIAAGSHWARRLADAAELPPNVQFIREALPFSALRELYQRASVVIVPLHDVDNQSGVTTMLEAMACGLPIVVSATRGQREVLAGVLCKADSSFEGEATADRGPRGCAAVGPAGLYVPVGDAGALRAAIRYLLDNPLEARKLGESGHLTAKRCFDTSAFVDAIAEDLVGEGVRE